MTLYEMNKAGYASLPNMSEEDKTFAKQLIESYIDTTYNNYYMILNHDIHYYTIYNWEDSSIKIFAQDIMDLMFRLGNVKAIERSQDESMIEFWIVDITGECHMYALFAYDSGVITI